MVVELIIRLTFFEIGILRINYSIFKNGENWLIFLRSTQPDRQIAEGLLEYYDKTKFHESLSEM